jgi:hypothetical protein
MSRLTPNESSLATRVVTVSPRVMGRGFRDGAVVDRLRHSGLPSQRDVQGESKMLQLGAIPGGVLA